MRVFKGSNNGSLRWATRLFVVPGMLVLSSCEKEIDIDYHTAAPQYVIEASVTQDQTLARITTTRGIEDQDRNSTFVTNAVAVVTSELGWRDTLQYIGNGRYSSQVKGMEGQTYTFDVDIDGQHFNSYSQMQAVPDVSECRLLWREIMGFKMLFFKLVIEDIPDKNNYYFMHIYRNNVGYRWAVMNDTKNPGGALQQLFSCGSEDNVKDLGFSNALHPGDRLRIEVRSMDQRAYDYLFSMQQMNGSGTNPIVNFTGGCLGFFSAYGLYNYSLSVDLGNIPVEEEE